jgi:hypothetical protein
MLVSLARHSELLAEIRPHCAARCDGLEHFHAKGRNHA